MTQNNIAPSWHPAATARLIHLWIEGASANQIAKQVGKSRNAVISKAKRLQLVKYANQKPTTSYHSRKGQTEFRKSVLHAYGATCCLTGSKQKEVLEAAHIVPYSKTKDNSLENGLCLRTDVHALFDAGVLNIKPDFLVEIDAGVIDENYQNLHGLMISRPIGADFFRMSELLKDRCQILDSQYLENTS